MWFSITLSFSQANGSQIKVGYRAILTKLARPRAYVQLFPEADGSWKELLEENMWLRRFPSDESASVDIPYFSVKRDRHRYIILDIKRGIILNLPPLISSNPSVDNKTFIILEHLSKYTFVQALDNRRTNSFTDSDFTIVVKEQTDHFDFYKFRSSVTISHELKLSIKFQNLTQNVLYFTVLNLISFWKIKRLYLKHKQYQIVLPRDSQKVFSRALNDIVKNFNISIMNRLESRFTISTQFRAQQQNSIIANDVFKFIVNTHFIFDIQNLKLPDFWHVIKYDVFRKDENFEIQMQKNLIEKKSTKSEQLKGKKSTIQ